MCVFEAGAGGGLWDVYEIINTNALFTMTDEDGVLTAIGFGRTPSEPPHPNTTWFTAT